MKAFRNNSATGRQRKESIEFFGVVNRDSDNRKKQADFTKIHRLKGPHHKVLRKRKHDYSDSLHL